MIMYSQYNSPTLYKVILKNTKTFRNILKNDDDTRDPEHSQPYTPVGSPSYKLENRKLKRIREFPNCIINPDSDLIRRKDNNRQKKQSKRNWMWMWFGTVKTFDRFIIVSKSTLYLSAVANTVDAVFLKLLRLQHDVSSWWAAPESCSVRLLSGLHRGEHTRAKAEASFFLFSCASLAVNESISLQPRAIFLILPQPPQSCISQFCIWRKHGTDQ